MIEDGRGDLFGTTQLGGPGDEGTVFELAAGSGQITTLAYIQDGGESDGGGMGGDFGLTETQSGDLFFSTLSVSTNNASIAELKPAPLYLTVKPAQPTVTTAPSPTTIAPSTRRVTLHDTATLSGGYYPTGFLDFALRAPGSHTDVYYRAVPVHGDGTYTAPHGFTLSATKSLPGTYQWIVEYTGDHNNIAREQIDSTITVTSGRASQRQGFRPDH